MHLLVVCHANVARSAAAAALLEGATDERGVALEIRSAGTHATPHQPSSARARTALGRRCNDPGMLVEHRARQLDDDDVAWADVIVAMEASQVRFVRRRFPDGADKTAALAVLARELPKDPRPLASRVASMSLAAHDDDGADDVEDPAGGDDDVYAATIEELGTLCGALATRLAG